MGLRLLDLCISRHRSAFMNRRQHLGYLHRPPVPGPINGPILSCGSRAEGHSAHQETADQRTR
jgi:hypothetical protein